MLHQKVLVLLLGILATSFGCELSSECDTACTILEAYITTARTTMGTKYRLLYHVAPPVGWMNDPNGFIYYKEKYHIFYQYYPYSATWGPMHWGHSTSTNLVTWETQYTALVPGTELCFSGSAIVLDTTLVLMYTGHLNGNETISADESQYLAFSDDGNVFHKYAGNPVLRYSATGRVADFRDPKVWKYGDYWYVVVGSKTTDGLRGRVLLYRSSDLVSWTYLSVLAESAVAATDGYMYECPDFFELGGKYILLMSPQGMTESGDRYKNLYQTGYIIGTFSYDTFQFVQETPFQEMDYGHDFYATQTTENGGKRYLAAWFGMWGETTTVLTESEDGWSGALTLFRELTLSGTRILANPVEAITSLRVTTPVLSGTLATSATITLEKTGEIIVTPDWTLDVELQFAGATTGGGSITIKWDVATQKVIVNRADDIRQVTWTPTGTWRIFLDTSSLELFCGSGEATFSSRVYPLGGWVVTNLSTQTLNVVAYTLTQSVPN